MTSIQRLVRHRIVGVVASFLLAGGAYAQFAPAEPEELGLSPSALDALADVVQTYVDDSMAVGGELLVIKGGRTVLHRAFGSRDLEDDIEWTIGTICNVRSMTKPMTGVAVQMCVDRGLLALDDTVATYIETFDTDELRDVTIDQLMSHQGGLPLTIFETESDLGRYGSLIGQAKAIGERGPQFEPGTKFWYSDAGSDVQAAIVEVVTEMTIDEFWERELFEPLGMDDTFVPLDQEDERFARIASLHVGGPNSWMRYWDPSKPSFYPFAWGSQTVFSTPMDYATFLWTWMHDGKGPDGTRVLSSRAVESMLEPQAGMRMLGSDQPFPTGFGDVEPFYGRMAQVWTPRDGEGGPVVIGHSGSDGTAAWAWPERDLMVLFFTQSRGGSSVLRFEEEIDRILLHPDRAEAKVPAELEPYVGTYIANFASFRNEKFRVLFRNDGLALDIPSQLTFDLLEPDEMGRRAFSLAPQIFVTFERDEEGSVHLLKLHQQGMVFEAPREGTALAAELAKRPEVDPASVEDVIGRYLHPQGEVVEIAMDGKTLTLGAPGGASFDLAPTDQALRFDCPQIPGASFEFKRDEDGRVVSLTRHLQGQAVAMSRIDDDEPPTR